MDGRALTPTIPLWLGEGNPDECTEENEGEGGERPGKWMPSRCSPIDFLGAPGTDHTHAVVDVGRANCLLLVAAAKPRACFHQSAQLKAGFQDLATAAVALGHKRFSITVSGCIAKECNDAHFQPCPR